MTPTFPFFFMKFKLRQIPGCAIIRARMRRRARFLFLDLPLTATIVHLYLRRVPLDVDLNPIFPAGGAKNGGWSKRDIWET